ncbi:nitrate reductase molybdenum cofactor assembly chaperone [Tsuneonella troitsensis]|uniref:nitrate reductase molybdenum cofactor assembly chaperone n=1 Tax=Tsuneonella troitsensis TaxID=292222 RepID=UPI000710FF2B|nr:nitrate reductase molybdenum cofactor assembly chaperone [Tsuneonella troitsensis]
MRLTLKAFAALLGYPSSELREHAGEIVEAVGSEGVLPRSALRRLQPLLDRLATDDLLDQQSVYSELFDRSRSLSLHLFEHVHGDSRERGQAMIDLGHQYLEHGFYLEASELPDFIPVFLEYAAFLPSAEARETIAQPAHVFAALAERLDKRDSDYAGVFHAIVGLAGARPDAAAVAQVDDNTPPVDPPVEEDWEETPVSFSAHAAHEMGGPTGPVARIRAANRAKAQEAGR